MLLHVFCVFLFLSLMILWEHMKATFPEENLFPQSHINLQLQTRIMEKISHVKVHEIILFTLLLLLPRKIDLMSFLTHFFCDPHVYSYFKRCFPVCNKTVRIFN